MPVTPTGTLSIVLSRLQKSIADSATFQSWTGLGSLTLALAAAVIGEAPASLVRPYVVIELPGRFDRALVSGRLDNNLPEARGTLVARFYDANLANGTNAQDALLGFANVLEGVLEDLEAVAGGVLSDGSLAFALVDAELAEQPQRPEEDEAKSTGDFFRAALRVSFRGPSP